MPSAAALAALQAAGIDAHKAPAPAGVCHTCCYRVAGQPVNLGRLRQLGADALAAKAAADATPSPDDRAAAVVAHLVRKFPVTTPETYWAAVVRLQDRGALITPGAVLREMERPTLPPVIVAPVTGGPVLPGEIRPPATPKGEGPGPELPPVGRLTRPMGATLRGPWDPGTPEARARVALQQERASILWPIARALTAEGVALPPSWASDGPCLNGERPLAAALSALPLGSLALAAAALGRIDPAAVTGADTAALALCLTGHPGPGRHPGL